jgi:DNA-binding Lrp family transcriptional regulator
MIPDKTDVKILKVITEDARLSYRKIAKKIGVSTLTVLSRMKKMEENGVIKGYSALIDHKQLGLDMTAILEVKTSKGHSSIKDQLKKLENVYGIWGVTGQNDLMILAKFSDTDMLSKFTKKIFSIPAVDGIETHLVLDTIKEDIF